MKLTELKEMREYINNPRKAINRHSIRYYQHEDRWNRTTFDVNGKDETLTMHPVLVLDRNLSTIPCSFSYYELDKDGKVVDREDIPNVTNWKDAEKWLHDLHAIEQKLMLTRL